MVWRLSPSGVSGLSISTKGTTAGDGGGDTTSFGTFLFCTFGIDVRVTSGDLDLLCKL